MNNEAEMAAEEEFEMTSKIRCFEETASVTRLLKFDAGHRVYGHQGKCQYPHGHEYHVQITATPCDGLGLDELGMVVDFSVIKEKVGAWIDENLDHGFLVYEEDHEMLNALRSVEGSKIYVMDSNPTAENIARLLMEKGHELLASDNVDVLKVRVQETSNCFATFKYVEVDDDDDGD